MKRVDAPSLFHQGAIKNGFREGHADSRWPTKMITIDDSCRGLIARRLDAEHKHCCPIIHIARSSTAQASTKGWKTL
jgi:hypothetical protein